VTKVSVGVWLFFFWLGDVGFVWCTSDIALLLSNAVIMPPSALDRLGKLTHYLYLRC
jgi:hypothetical protein